MRKINENNIIKKWNFGKMNNKYFDVCYILKYPYLLEDTVLISQIIVSSMNK